MIHYSKLLQIYKSKWSFILKVNLYIIIVIKYNCLMLKDRSFCNDYFFYFCLAIVIFLFQF